MRNLYELLGVPKSADQAAIKKAYKKLAREHHPDLNKAAGAADRFKEVTAAYEVLGDEQKRALYDEFGEVSLQSGFDPERARAWKAGAGRRYAGGPFDGSDLGEGVGLDDLFGSLFGGRRRAGPSAPRRGADIEAALEVDLVSALRGEAQTLEFQRPARCNACDGAGGTGRASCSRCGGSGRVAMRGLFEAVVACDDCGGTGSTFAAECAVCAGTGRARTAERLKVTLPKGVRDGQVIRLRGKGGDGRHAQESPGDLLLQVSIRPHAFLQREGQDLLMEVPITFGEALTGATVSIPTVDGGVKVKVPAGAKNGQRLRLRGKGVTSGEGEPGDLYVVLRPTPPPPTQELAELAKALDAAYTSDVRGELKL